MHTLTPSTTHGRYQCGDVELTAGDVIEFDAFNGARIRGRVEHADGRYYVMAGDRRLPLAELVTARYVGRGTLA